MTPWVPGSMGPKPSLQNGSLIRESAPQVSPWNAPLAIKQAGAAGVGARELDGGLHAFAAGIGEVDALESAAGELYQALRELGGELRHVALQHGGAGAVQFVLERGDDGGMVVAGVVHAVAGEEIENAAAVGGEEFGGGAAFVLHVHLQNVEQLDPLRVDVVGIESVKRRNCGSHEHCSGSVCIVSDVSNRTTVPSGR